MFSIYTSAFNLIKNNFSYKQSIENFCNIAEEVVVAINKSEDSTLESVKSLSYKNLNIIEVDIPYTDPLLDGKIKNAALQGTTKEFKIGLDMDEYIPLNQKTIWENLAQQLRFDDVDCYMIPSLNLYKDKYHYFSITNKWYLHKANLYRGPVNFGRRSNGTIDTTKSDGCELIDINGNLAKSKYLPNDINILRQKNIPFVVHTGYISLDDRVLRNKNFWEKHWLIESGGEKPKHKVHLSLEEFREAHYPHLLDI